MHHFVITVQVEGVHERHVFDLSSSSFPQAVKRGVEHVTRQNPAAEFVGLTYHHPPITDPTKLEGHSKQPS
jgi:hypothetical protein